jgi:hypothetical protein
MSSGSQSKHKPGCISMVHWFTGMNTPLLNGTNMRKPSNACRIISWSSAAA